MTLATGHKAEPMFQNIKKVKYLSYIAGNFSCFIHSIRAHISTYKKKLCENSTVPATEDELLYQRMFVTAYIF